MYPRKREKNPKFFTAEGRETVKQSFKTDELLLLPLSCLHSRGLWAWEG